MENATQNNTMYAVVEYNNYYKEQDFEIKFVTENLEMAKKLVFTIAMKAVDDVSKNGKIFKLTTDIEKYHLFPKNERIIEYMMIEVKQNKKGNYKVLGAYSNVYSVIKFNNNIKLNMLMDIDKTKICNNYIPHYCDTDDDDMN